MCRYLPSSAVNRPVGLGVYTKAMMNNRILTICAAIAAGMVGTSLAHAQQGYPAQGQVYQGQVYQGQVYQGQAPGQYVPGGYATDDWQIPHARCATGQRRQAQKSGSTLTGRSR